jgi:hypothetical protein
MKSENGSRRTIERLGSRRTRRRRRSEGCSTTAEPLSTRMARGAAMQPKTARPRRRIEASKVALAAARTARPIDPGPLDERPAEAAEPRANDGPHEHPDVVPRHRQGCPVRSLLVRIFELDGGESRLELPSIGPKGD